MRIPDISPSMFYAVGKYAFFTMAVIGLIRIVDLFSELKSYDIFSSLASSIFYFVLAWFFASLGKKELIKELSDEDVKKMNDALNKLKLEE